MLSRALARRVRWQEGGQRASARLSTTITPPPPPPLPPRRPAACGLLPTTERTATLAGSARTAAARQPRRHPCGRRFSCSLQRPASAQSSGTRTKLTSRRTTTDARLGRGASFGGDGGCGGGGGGARGWRNRRPFCSAGTVGCGGDGEDGRPPAATMSGRGAPPAPAAPAAGGGTRRGGAADGQDGAGGDGDREEKPPPQQQQRKKRRSAGTAAAKPKKPNYPFGTPLSVLAAQSAEEGREDGLGYRAGGGGGIDAEDQLPDPTLVEVARDGDGDGLPSDINDPRTRVAAARPEVVHALCRGLPEGQTRQVADTLCTYSGTARTTEDTLARLEKMLGQRSDNALDWAMPLIRAHVTGEAKPSAETHGQYLTVARDTNIKEISPEEMSEKLLRSFARHKWGPDMTRERLRTEHLERWEEAMSLSNKLADRLPVCRYKLVGRTLENFLKADKTRRRHRVLGEIAKILKSRMHLVLPAIADFWRVQQLGKRLQDDIEQAKIDFLEEQALLARWLLFARTKAFPTVEELKGPWSIEEIEELQEARARDEARKWEEENSREDEDEEGDEDDLAEGVGGGEGEDGVNRHRQKKLNTAAIDVISRALPPQMPEIQQPDPLGLFELFVVEYPREFWRPPPPDIFGGDIPMGGQYTAEDVGLSEPLPVWKAAGAGKRETLTAIEEREAERERSARGEQYEWPEEKEARMKEEEETWWRGAGDKKKELSKPRSQDYRQVEDVLLKGERVKRTPEVTMKDILEGLPMMQMKAQLAKRAALVAELHPDEERQKELQLEEEGSRTVFVRGLPYGLSPWTVKEAFARCGDVRQVIIKEPTFREGDGGGELLPSSAPSTTSKRAFEPKSQSPFATSVPHGLVVFNDHEAYERATAKSFRIFGVNIEGVSVTTKPASQCHTLFVENIAMRTGLEMTDAINEAISPHYEVGLKSHFLDDETPQVVAIPLRKYVAVRAMDQILTAAGFCTTYYYNVPKVPAHKACENDFSWTKPGDRRGRHASHFDEDEPMPADDFLQQALDELEERSAS